MIEKSLNSYYMSHFYILWDFVQIPEILLMILDNFKGHTVIPFVLHTIIFSEKTAQT